MNGNDIITSQCQTGDAGLKRPKPGDQDRNPRVTDGGVNGKMAREDSTGDFSFKKWDVGREMERS